MNLDELVNFFIKNGIVWVQSQRDAHRPTARSFSEQERSELVRFFESETLDCAKVKLVPLIENPEFYSILRSMGISVPLDFSAMSGITFLDTILISELKMPQESRWISLLFHELVHVIQYEIFGVRAFVERYVRGWAENGFDYHRIPLEHHAYKLQERYEAYPGAGFSVEAEVRQMTEFY